MAIQAMIHASNEGRPRGSGVHPMPSFTLRALILAASSAWWLVALPAAALGTAALMLAARLGARAIAAARTGLRTAPAADGLTATDPDHLGRRCAAVLAAGACALVAAGLAATGAAVAAERGGAPPALPLAVGLAAALTALVVLVPLRPLGGGPRDLALLLEWWRWPGAAKRRVAIDVLAELARRGRRPRDWPETWVRLATGAPDGGRADATACWYGYLWAMDTGAAGVARALLERALRRAGGPASQPRLLAECVFHVAWVWGDGDHAEALLTLLPSHPASRLERRKALAAVQLATGDPARAAASARAWLEATAPPAGGRQLQAGVVAAMREWVSALEAAALARVAVRRARHARAS